MPFWPPLSGIENDGDGFVAAFEKASFGAEATRFSPRQSDLDDRSPVRVTIKMMPVSATSISNDRAPNG